LLDSPAGPKRKGKFKLIRGFIGNCLFQPLFLLWVKRTATARFESPLFGLDQTLSLFFVSPKDLACIGEMDADNFADLFVGFARFAKHYNLLSQLLLYLRFSFLVSVVSMQNTIAHFAIFWNEY
jgi:hypothetical protein